MYNKADFTGLEVVALRKIRLVAVLLLALFLLSSCGAGGSIDELLVAPTLSQDQSDIKSAVDALSPDKVKLKYPLAGDRRGAINMIDMDGDGALEAVVFYNVAAEGIFTRVAVLKRGESGWSIIDTMDGEGTDVESFEIIRMQDRSTQVLIEWSSASTGEHSLRVYHLENEKLEPGYKKNCVDLYVTDLNQDGNTEIWYITEGGAGGFQLSYLELGGEFPEGPVVDLNDHMLASAGMIAGSLPDGTLALFIDEVIDNESRTTEAFMMPRRSVVSKANYADGDYDIAELTVRANSQLRADALRGDGIVYMPSDTPPDTDAVVSPESWTYWYTINEGELTFAFAAHVESRYSYAVSVPNEWLAHVSVSVSENEPRRLVFYDVSSQQMLLEFRLLSVGEDAEQLLADGFSLLTRVSPYKYYYKSYTDDREAVDYIVNNFLVFN